MIQIAALHISTDRLEVLRRFYGALLRAEPAWQDDTSAGFMAGAVRIEIALHDRVSGPSQQPERLFFDLLVDDVAVETTRIAGLGGRVVQEPYEFEDGDLKMTIATLSDPDGNFFQLVSTEN